MTRRAPGLAVLLLACSCGNPAGPQARPEPVVVYAAYADQGYLPALFDAFTGETGIPVTLHYAGENRIVSDVVGNRGSPPADVLLTSTVQGVWRAADEGALRPLDSAIVGQNVPAVLRDADDYWVATGVELAVVAAGPGTIEGISDYAELGDPGLARQLCLVDSSQPINRAVVAQLIAEHGIRPAELIVRGWIRNLAMPPFPNEAQLLGAIAAGQCALGLVSHVGARESGLAMSVPVPVVVAVEAAGVARHARNPDAARRLIEWLTGKEAQRRHARERGHLAANPEALGQDLPEMRRPAIAGAYDQDATKLAERAGWR